MKCDRAREELQRYLEGTLRGKDLAVLEQHLEDCHDCRGELEILRELDGHLRVAVPRIWKDLEPSPVFLARLKGLKLERPFSRIDATAEWVAGLWQKHRTALAASAAILLIIALVFTVPAITSPDEDVPVISEKLPQAMVEGPALTDASADKRATEAAEPSPTAKLMVPAPTATPTATMTRPTPTPSPTPAPTVMPTPAPVTPKPTAAAEPPYIVGGAGGLSREQSDLAKEIALLDARVQEAIKGLEAYDTEVFSGTMTLEDFTWAGPTVLITRNAADPREGFLYAFVDLDKREVVKMILVPSRPTQ